MKLVLGVFACVELLHPVMAAQRHLHVMPPTTSVYVEQQVSTQLDVQSQGKLALQELACVER